MLDQAHSFATVARKIGDCRLETALQELAATVVQRAIHNASQFVSRRADIRSDIKRLKAEARRFETALRRISAHILDMPPPDAELLEAKRSVGQIARWCDATLSAVPGRGGAPKRPGRVACAMIVIEAWAVVRGRTPGANNKHVQEVCDDYWCACGCKSLGDPGNWRRSMAAALKNKSQLRRYIIREVGTE